MNIHLIDDEEYAHDDAALKLKMAGFDGKLKCYFDAGEFFMETAGLDLSNDLIVVDYELGSETAVEARIAERVREKPFRKLMLYSVLPAFGSEGENVTKMYDAVFRKEKMDWKSLID